jgi:hypothetical protein
MPVVIWLVLLATAGLPVDRPQCQDASSDQFFFPDGSLGRRWYSQHLRAMSEPSLSCGRPKGEVYRFLWLRTWGRPVAVRVEAAPGDLFVAAVELDGAAGRPGKVSRRVEGRKGSEYHVVDRWSPKNGAYRDLCLTLLKLAGLLPTGEGKRDGIY